MDSIPNENMAEITDPMERFHAECLAKHRRGVLEHRGGDESRPFTGHLPTEYCQEQLDSVNYLRQMMERGIIPEIVYQEGWKLHFSLWWMVQQRMGDA